MRAEIALMSGSAFAVTHHAFSSGAGRTSDGNGSHASTLKSPSYTKSVSWQHYRVVKHITSVNPGWNSGRISFTSFLAIQTDFTIILIPRAATKISRQSATNFRNG
ncbi:hypothetical protein ACNKHU_17355 [Shigella flexneri]